MAKTYNRLNLCLAFLAMILFSISLGCNKDEEKDNNPCKVGRIPPPEFYEFNLRVGDGKVDLNWHFPGLEDYAYEVEVTYNVNGIEKVQKAFRTMTISDLNNGEKYKFLMIGIDKCGNRYNLGSVSATPNTPFVVISPINSDGYSIVDGKVRIDLRFNRPADTTYMDYPILMDNFIQLSAGLSYQPNLSDNAGLTKVPYSY